MARSSDQTHSSTKRCASCKVSKPQGEFYRCGPHKRLHSWCKSCCSERNKASRDRNPPSQDAVDRRRAKDRKRGQTTIYKERNAARMRGRPVEVQMLDKAKQRAGKKGVAFNLTLEDIKIPKVCPVLGIVIRRNVGAGHCDSSPTLDRVEPTKGYVADNVWVISWRANRLKSDASLDELKLLVAALTKRGCGGT